MVCCPFWKILPCEWSLRGYSQLLPPHVSCFLQFALCQRMRAFLASTARSFSPTHHPPGLVPGLVSGSDGRGMVPVQTKQQPVDDQSKSGMDAPEEGDTTKVTRSNLQSPNQYLLIACSALRPAMFRSTWLSGISYRNVYVLPMPCYSSSVCFATACKYSVQKSSTSRGIYWKCFAGFSRLYV